MPGAGPSYCWPLLRWSGSRRPPGMRLPLAALCCTVLSSIPGASGTVTVSNVVPRTDSSGAYMDAHDGNTIQYIEGGPYFW